MNVGGIHRPTGLKYGERNLRSTCSTPIRVVEQSLRGGVEMEPFAGRSECIRRTGAEYTSRIGPAGQSSAERGRRNFEHITLDHIEVEDMVGTRLVAAHAAVR